jgi:hypothetical protein
MKRLLLTPLVLLAAMVSCEKETPLSEAIIGKWDVISVMQVTYKNDFKESETTFFYIASEMSFQFAEAGTGIYYENGDVYGMFSWTLSGNTLTMPGTTPTVWEMSIDNDNLKWTFSEVDDSDATIHYVYTYTSKRIN